MLKRAMAIRVASRYLKAKETDVIYQKSFSGELPVYSKTQLKAYSNIINHYFMPFIHMVESPKLLKANAELVDALKDFQKETHKISQFYSMFYSGVKQFKQVQGDLHPAFEKDFDRVVDLVGETYNTFSMCVKTINKMNQEIHAKKFHNCYATFKSLYELSHKNFFELSQISGELARLSQVASKHSIQAPVAQQPEEEKKGWFKRLFKLASVNSVKELEHILNWLLAAWDNYFVKHFYEEHSMDFACNFYSQLEVLQDGFKELVDTMLDTHDIKSGFYTDELYLRMYSQVLLKVDPLNNQDWAKLYEATKSLVKSFNTRIKMYLPSAR